MPTSSPTVLRPISNSITSLVYLLLHRSCFFRFLMYLWFNFNLIRLIAFLINVRFLCSVLIVLITCIPDNLGLYIGVSSFISITIAPVILNCCISRFKYCLGLYRLLYSFGYAELFYKSSYCYTDLCRSIVVCLIVIWLGLVCKLFNLCNFISHGVCYLCCYQIVST